MRIAIASDIGIGSHRAHAINVVKTAGGFARLGHDVVVLLRASDEGVTIDDAVLMYGEPSLEWRLAGAAASSGDVRDRQFGAWAVSEACEFGADVLYARHFRAAIAGAATGLPTVLETHAYIGDTNPVLDEALKATHTSLAGVATISRRLRDHYVRRGAEASRVHVVPDGVDLDLFTRPDDPGDDPMAGYPRPRALYAGHLYDYKGVPTLIDAAGLMDDVGVHLLGGSDEDIERVRREAGDRVHVHGRVAHAEVARWLWHADVLVLPPSAREPSCAWTSPVKLGEYLASGTPIVASDIPALRDWIEEAGVVEWFEPDDGASLAAAIRRALEGRCRQERRARAHALASRFSYANRAAALLAMALRGTLTGSAR